MRVNCCCCLELLTPADRLLSPPCGHVMHDLCLRKWIESNKTGSCPQCREKCKESQLRRIYFTEGMDATINEDGDGSDANVLQNKLDHAAYKLRMEEMQTRKLREENEKLKAQNTGLVAEVKTSERKRQEAKDEVLEARTKMRYVQAEKELFKKAQEEARDLKERLHLYESIDTIVKGSIAEVNDRLHEVGDYSKTSRELNMIIVAMKREMKAQAEDRSTIKAEARAKARQVQELKAKLTDLSRQVQDLTSENGVLASDLRHAEEERVGLKKKVSTLQEALDSPSGDAKTSAINRMVAEYPMPMPAIKSDSEGEEEKKDSPFLRTKSCGIVGLNKRKKTPCQDTTNYSQMNIMKKPRVGLLSQNGDGGTSLAMSQPLSQGSSSGQVRDKFYDGFGGHSKPDMFPSRLNGGFKTLTKKAPKGISRPKAAPKPKGDIDKFFNFDTP